MPYVQSMAIGLCLTVLAASLPVDEDNWEESGVETTLNQATLPCTEELQAILRTCAHKALSAKDKAAASCKAAEASCGSAKKVAKTVKAKAAELAKADNMILDAGSGGTKIFAFKDGKTWDNANLDSKCVDKNHPNLGLAMLPYPPASCQQRLQLWAPRKSIGGTNKVTIAVAFEDSFPKGEEVKNKFAPNPTQMVPAKSCDSGSVPHCVDIFKAFILKGIETYYKVTHASTEVPWHSLHLTTKDVAPLKAELASSTKKPKNAAAIPIVATAGMRMLDDEDNNKVWDNICGGKATTTGYNFAPKGTSCGTISGTTEAFYEYLGFKAKAGKGEEGYTANTGTFTIGGASAQIAIPLANTEVASFHTLMATVADTIKCGDIKLKNTKPAPKFEENAIEKLGVAVGTEKAKALNEKDHGCITDYVDLKTEPSGAKVGTISFLDLAAGQAHGAAPIAGGAQEMMNWAEKACAVKTREECVHDLEEELKTDKLWGAVKTWFTTTEFGAHSFAYATGNANQELAEHPAADLISHPASVCGTLNGGKLFNPPHASPKDKTEEEANADEHKKSGKCVKAEWAKIYLTAFFGGPKHELTQAKLGPNSDWATGFPLSLLEVDIDRVKFHYTDGFFAAHSL